MSIKYIFQRALSFVMVTITLMLVNTSCIENDIPYPNVEMAITALEFEDQVGNTVIDAGLNMVSVNVSETADLKKLVVTEYSFVDALGRSDIQVGDTLNLVDPLVTKLSLYQDYQWTIKAKQPIERYFEIENQVGASTIDVQSKVAIAYLKPTISLARVKIKGLKLDRIGSTYVPNDLEGKVLSFTTKPLTVEVDNRGVVETWTLYVEHKEELVSVTKLVPWVEVVWMFGDGVESNNRGFEYRKDTETEWTKVDPSLIENKGSEFVARVTNLDPEQTYVVRSYADDNYSSEVEVTTLKGIQLPNSNLDSWWLENKKIWNPWVEGEAPFWSTGNKGSSTMGQSNTVPTDDTWDGKPGKAAYLESKFVGIGSIGKFAAGNLFVGDFVKVDGTNGILDFGKEFSTFPTRVKFHYKYKGTAISHVDRNNATMAEMKGQPDSCFVYMALGDWDQQVRIQTNPKDLMLFSKDDPKVIAYSEFCSAETVGQYTEVVMELDYRDLDRTPRYLLFVASASKYGDYFTGGQGSVLQIDNIVLEYD